jgi:hypothetical protein
MNRDAGAMRSVVQVSDSEPDVVRGKRGLPTVAGPTARRIMPHLAGRVRGCHPHAITRRVVLLEGAEGRLPHAGYAPTGTSHSGGLQLVDGLALATGRHGLDPRNIRSGQQQAAADHVEGDGG